MEQPMLAEVPVESSSAPSRWARWRNALALAMLLLAVLAAIAPLRRAEVPGRVGFLLILGALTEILHGFRRSTAADQRSAWLGGGITLLMGWMLLHAAYFASAAVLILLALWFALDAVRHFASLIRRKSDSRPAWLHGIFGLANLSIAVGLIASPVLFSAWAIAFAASARLFGIASNIASAPVFDSIDSGATVVQGLGLEQPELQELATAIAREETDRASIDRGWIVGLLLVLLAIHLGRMGFDRTFLGVVAPGVAVLGDVLLGLVLTFVLIVPLGSAWRWGTRRVERRLWTWCLAAPAEQRGRGRRIVEAALKRRLRVAIRLRQVRYSLRAALSRGMQTGLPLAAIIAATAPTFGLSWYFDTENWAAGMWNSWAAERTDDWREAMIRAEKEHNPTVTFAVHPPGIRNGEDFSFLVIGDTGEGDASQHVLRAQYLEVVRRPEVKFVVVSSDVVYPTGAMRDYEWKFWLPFMGTEKPVYAIPGNHDWYDANEAFNATFLKPDSARRAMRARLDVDRRISSTTDRRIEDLIRQADRLKAQYRVPTQQQEAPFFQFQTDRFALIAVDTGVMRRIDAEQMQWLKATLESAKGKTIMAILGHPLYAGGHYAADGDEEFEAIHALLREYGASIVMAGDTHDFEHYAEPTPDGVMRHFVNGGGGAYLSYGSALAWPKKPATAEWAFYPTTEQVSNRIEGATPWWKQPAWWWTKNYGAYPFSAEWLSALFDSNYAPFYQSFCEIRVEPTTNRIRILPYGIHGRLRWADLQVSSNSIPTGKTANDFAEWTIPLRR
jgi:uncharacterized membrane protein HdeD (DUF308 family)